MLRALDAVDQLAATLSEAAGKTVVPGNLLTDGSTSVIFEAGFDISPSGFLSASGGMTVPAGAKPPISNGASFGTTPGMAARVAKLPVDMLEEGLEEVLSDELNPLVNRIANSIDGGNRDTTMPTAEGKWMDFTVGAALGGAGHGVNVPGTSRQFGYMSQDNPYAAYMLDLLKTSAAENTAVPEDVMKNAKAIMPKATDAEIQEYYERYVKDMGQASESFAYNDLA